MITPAELTRRMADRIRQRDPEGDGARRALRAVAFVRPASPQPAGCHPAFRCSLSRVRARSMGALARAQPQEPQWSALMQAAGVDSAYLYTPEGAGFRARMFSPTAGIPEDPATGSASAILAAALWRAGDLGAGETRLALRQGVEMGRPSTIDLRIVADSVGLTSVHVAGQAVQVASGQIAIPRGE